MIRYRKTTDISVSPVRYRYIEKPISKVPIRYRYRRRYRYIDIGDISTIFSIYRPISSPYDIRHNTVFVDDNHSRSLRDIRRTKINERFATVTSRSIIIIIIIGVTSVLRHLNISDTLGVDGRRLAAAAAAVACRRTRLTPGLEALDVA